MYDAVPTPGAGSRSLRACVKRSFNDAMEMRVMPKSFALVKANRFALLLAVAAAGAGILAQADPVDVQQQLLDALARSDVAGGGRAVHR
jgi:hypothetical protein